MDIDRRQFVTLGALGMIGAAAGCKPFSQPPSESPLAARGAALLDLRINVLGGLALVFTKSGKLAAGSVKLPSEATAGCTSMAHPMVLQLIAGTLKRDTTSLPRVSGGDDAKFKEQWTVNGGTLSLVEGHNGANVNAPAFRAASGATEDVPLPTSSGWNDWNYIHAPTQYHQGSQLANDWRDRTHGRIELVGGDLRVIEETHPCGSVGRWEGRANGSETIAFKKPIANQVLFRAKSASPVVRFSAGLDESGGEREIVIEPTGSAVELTVRIDVPAFGYNINVGDRLMHMSMFYELISPSIPCDQRLLPSYLGGPMEGHDCTIKPGTEGDPGVYCPANRFQEI